MQARAAAGETIDLIEAFAGAIPVEIIGNLLGVPHDERGPLRGWSLAILGALEPVLSAPAEALGNRGGARDAALPRRRWSRAAARRRATPRPTC